VTLGFTFLHFLLFLVCNALGKEDKIEMLIRSLFCLLVDPILFHGRKVVTQVPLNINHQE